MKMSFFKKHKLMSAMIMIVLVAGFALLLNHLLVIRPLQRELVGTAVEFVFESRSAYVLPVRYQDDGQNVPELVVQAIKDDYKAFLNDRLVQDSNLARQDYEVLCDLLDRQINGEIEMIKSVDCQMIKLGKIRIDGDKASVQMTIRMIETKQYAREFTWLITIGFIKIDNQWRIITQGVNFAPAEA